MLADVGMPERDGYEVAAFIKGDPELAHIPVLLLTGAFEPVDEARARAVGCDGVLVKPFEPQMVISRVRDLLAGKREPARPAAQAGACRRAAPTPPAGTPRSRRPRSKTISIGSTPRSPARGHRHRTLDPVPAATPALAVVLRPTLAAASVGADAPPARAPHAEMDLAGWNPPAASAPEERYAGGRSPSHPGHLRSRTRRAPPAPTSARRARASPP